MVDWWAERCGMGGVAAGDAVGVRRQAATSWKRNQRVHVVRAPEAEKRLLPLAVAESTGAGVRLYDIAAANPGGDHSGWSLERMLILSPIGVPWWPNTFQLDRSALGQAIGPVTEQVSWAAYLGQPMKQTVPETCALVACTVAVEAMHRFVHAAHHGGGKQFRWTAAEPDGLLEACKRQGIWKPKQGAKVGEVLDKIKDLIGVTITNPPTGALYLPQDVLPLSSWREHRWDDPLGLSPERVAKLLDCGPCVGTLCVCPWYRLFDATLHDGAWVYRGCGRSQDDREESKRLYGDDAGSHAVVCFGYRRCGDQMHVLILDNHTPTGPWRWVHVEEILALYTLDVDCLDGC